MRTLDLTEEEFKSLKEYIARTKAVYYGAFSDHKVSIENYNKMSDVMSKLQRVKRCRVRYDKTKTERYMQENGNIIPTSPKLNSKKGVLFIRKVDGELGYYENGDKKKVRMYVGEIEKGLPNGQGTLTAPDGTKYKGGFNDGKFCGQGTINYFDGRKYVGEWKNGKYNGQGTFTWPNGDKYDGGYKDNEKHGQGTLTYISGTIEKGEWKDGKIWNGDLTYPNSFTHSTWIRGKKI